MGIHQARRNVSARELLSSGDWLGDEAPGRINPQIYRPVTVRHWHGAHNPRHPGIISPVPFAQVARSCLLTRRDVDSASHALPLPHPMTELGE
jgi:hypothetical protein